MEQKESEKDVTLADLQKFQAVIRQREALTTEFEKKLADMFAKIENFNLLVYQQQLYLFECYDHIQALYEKPMMKKVRRRLLCSNAKEYLAAGHMYIMPILNHFRENRDLFRYFIYTLDAMPAAPHYVHSYLAEDLIQFLFTDYSSCRASTILILRQFAHLYQQLFQSHERKLAPTLLRDSSLANRLLHEYVNKPDDREYALMVFGPVFRKALDLGKYLRELRNGFAASNQLESNNVVHKLLASEECVVEVDTSALPGLKLESGVAGLQGPELSVEERILLCEDLLRRVVKNLQYMPLSMRYICKLLATLNNDAVSQRQLVFDIVFYNSWRGMLYQPAVYGFVKQYDLQDPAYPQLDPVVQALEALFYGQELAETSVTNAMLNCYIRRKSTAIDRYVSDLLTIVLPSFEVPLQEDNNVSLTSLCFTLEGYKFIHEFMREHLADLTAICPPIAVLFRYADCTFCPQTTSTFPSKDLFAPLPGTFTLTSNSTAQIYAEAPELGDLAPPSHPPKEGEFVEGRHYLLLHKTQLKEDKKDEPQTETWQRCLNQILNAIDLSAYEDRRGQDEAAGSELLSLLRQIYKQPRTFVINPDSNMTIKLMASYLLTHFGVGAKGSAREQLTLVCANYMSSVQNKVNKKQQIEAASKVLVDRLKSRIKTIAYLASAQVSEVRNAILAANCIETYSCEYEISLNSSPASPTPPSRSASMLVPSWDRLEKAGSPESYVINFSIAKQPSRASKVSKKKVVEETPTPKAQRHDKLLNFLEMYLKLEGVTTVVATGEDPQKTAAVFTSFMEKLKEQINHNADLQDLIQKDKDNIFDHVYDYTMRKIYAQVFPLWPVEKDLRFLKNILHLQSAKPKDFGVRSELVHEELWEHTIKQLAKLDEERTPADKMLRLDKANHLLTSSVAMCLKSKEGPGADEVTPILIYLVMRAAPIHLTCLSNYINFYSCCQTKLENAKEMCKPLQSAYKFLTEFHSSTLQNARPKPK